MKKTGLIVLSLLFAACSQQHVPVYDVLNYGACSDGTQECSAAINAAISDCSANGGGIVLVPAGKYLCSTLVLQSNVNLKLEKDAEILACEDPESYQSFVPKRDMSMYDSGNGTVNQNNSRDQRWNHALILANAVENISITGEGTINGRHVFDPQGEEFMRGPHTLVFGDCRNVLLDGITITCAANYAFMAYALSDAVFHGVKISEGWDGIHIRGGENVVIDDCFFETGDDTIAGGYWKNMDIRNCYINSSCNGLRMIMPSENVDIHDCHFEGPGHFPHRTSGEARRTNMLFGVVFEPGGWGKAPGELKGLKVRNCTIKNTQTPIAVSVSPDNKAYDLSISNVTAPGTYGDMLPITHYNDKGGFQSITVDNFTVSR